MKMDDLGVPPFLETPICMQCIWVVATQRIFIYTQKIGEMIQFDDHIVQMGGSTTKYIHIYILYDIYIYDMYDPTINYSFIKLMDSCHIHKDL